MDAKNKKKQKSASYLCLVHVHSTYVTPRTRKKREALTAIIVTKLCFLINYKHSNIVSFNNVYVHAFEPYYRYKTLHFHLQQKSNNDNLTKKTTLRNVRKNHLYNVIMTNKDIGTSQISV